MKCRNGFVTNSSSSSFIIAKKYLDEDQIKAIYNHIELWRELGNEVDKEDSWGINENKKFITGYTHMDNFNMWNFLKEIDVNPNKITWGIDRFDLFYDVEDDLNDLTYDKEAEWRELIHEM